MTSFPDRPFLYSELNSLGLTRAAVREAEADGRVRRLLHGVYCAAGLPDSVELRARAASLVLPKHVVVSDQSAAWLHSIDAYDPRSLDLPPQLFVVSLRGRERTRRSDVVAGQRDLAKDDICVLHGINVTTPLRTASDLACLRGRPAALAILDAFMRHSGVTTDEYAGSVRRFRGRRGVRQFRELAAHATPLAESPAESWTRLAIIDAGLPIPTPQFWVMLDGFGRVRLDLAYPALKIAVEYDGEQWHSSTAQRLDDERRRTALRQAGWIVIVVKKHDLASVALDRWLGELRSAIDARRPDVRRCYPRAPADSRRQRRSP